MGSKAEALQNSGEVMCQQLFITERFSSTTSRAATPQTLTACRAFGQNGVTGLLTQHPGQLQLHAARIKSTKVQFYKYFSAVLRHAFPIAAPTFAVAAGQQEAVPANCTRAAQHHCLCPVVVAAPSACPQFAQFATIVWSAVRLLTAFAHRAARSRFLTRTEFDRARRSTGGRQLMCMAYLKVIGFF